MQQIIIQPDMFDARRWTVEENKADGFRIGAIEQASRGFFGTGQHLRLQVNSFPNETLEEFALRLYRLVLEATPARKQERAAEQTLSLF